MIGIIKAGREEKDVARVRTYSSFTEAWLDEVFLFSSRGFFLGTTLMSTLT